MRIAYAFGLLVLLVGGACATAAPDPPASQPQDVAAQPATPLCD